MNLIERVVENFPDLTYCKLIVRGADSHVKDITNDTNVLPWMKWFHSTEDAFDWLRIKISSQQYLIFRRITGNQFLIIINERENKTLLLNYLRKELSEIFEGKIIKLNHSAPSQFDGSSKQAS
ncbi:MAG: hypothetical protein RIA69_17565 [Cyclobacteriaceae bacterium]